MWIKYDGKKCVIKSDRWDNIGKEIQLPNGKWIHCVETSQGKVYIGGEEIKEEDFKK